MPRPGVSSRSKTNIGPNKPRKWKALGHSFQKICNIHGRWHRCLHIWKWFKKDGVVLKLIWENRETGHKIKTQRRISRKMIEKWGTNNAMAEFYLSEWDGIERQRWTWILEFQYEFRKQNSGRCVERTSRDVYYLWKS